LREGHGVAILDEGFGEDFAVRANAQTENLRCSFGERPVLRDADRRDDAGVGAGLFLRKPVVEVAVAIAVAGTLEALLRGFARDCGEVGGGEDGEE
jgi:hypothetical protein